MHVVVVLRRRHGACSLTPIPLHALPTQRSATRCGFSQLRRLLLVGCDRTRLLDEILFELLFLHRANDLSRVHDQLLLWLFVSYWGSFFSVMLLCWMVRRLSLVFVVTAVSLMSSYNWTLGQEIIHGTLINNDVVPSCISDRRARVILHVRTHRGPNHITVTIYSLLSWVFIGRFSTFIFIVWGNGNDKVLKKLIFGDCKVWWLLIAYHLLWGLCTSSSSLTALLLNDLWMLLRFLPSGIVRVILFVPILLRHAQVLMWLQLSLIQELRVVIIIWSNIRVVYDGSTS